LANTEHPETTVTSKKISKANFFIKNFLSRSDATADLPPLFDGFGKPAPNQNIEALLKAGV